MEGRNIATRSMLPHWEGVCLDDAGKEMTAWDAIQKVQNVAHCMTKRNTKQDQKVYSYDVVYYNFGKVRAISYFKVYSCVILEFVLYLCIFQFPDTCLLS